MRGGVVFGDVVVSGTTSEYYSVGGCGGKMREDEVSNQVKDLALIFLVVQIIFCSF